MTPRPSTTVGAFEAKVKFSELLDLVEQGDAVVITRNGLPIARLVPFRPEIDAGRVRRAANELLAQSRGARLPAGTTLRD